jgi:D-3-phosphoglycerate dehydrogenase
MKVLANDGISKSGILALEKRWIEVITTKVAQEQVANFVNENNVDVVLVRKPRYVKTLSMLVGLKLLVVAA